MPNAAYVRPWEFPNPQKMSERKSHIDDNFIPEGLEFREEYLHAALSNYRRHKRGMFWRKTRVFVFVLLMVASACIALWNKPMRQTQVEAETKSTHQAIEQKTISNDSSSILDLDNDEGVLNKNRLRPADESQGASQEKSKQAVGMGDPMSSGVGLPGRLSISGPKVHESHGLQPQETIQDFNDTDNSASLSDNVTNYQVRVENASQNETTNRMDVPYAMSYLGINSLLNEKELQPNKPIPLNANRRWTLHAILGAKLWANYSFGPGVRKIDPMLSLGAEYKWRKRMGLFVNAQFFTVSGVAEPYVAKQRQYDQGYRETTFSYHTDRFFYTGLSIGCNYRISRAHSMGVLYDFNYLLTTDNRITTGNSSSFEGATSFEEKAKGYVTGFRPFQHSLGLVYEFSMGKNKSIGTSYRIGLSDVTRNEYFGNEFHRNSLLAVHLKIKLK
jgi:hypothetical protein